MKGGVCCEPWGSGGGERGKNQSHKINVVKLAKKTKHRKVTGRPPLKLLGRARTGKYEKARGAIVE